MMDLFLGVLDLSKTGSLVILGVILLRFLLKKAPKIFSYALWSLVLVRLLCPISIEAPVSILPETEPVRQSFVSFSGSEALEAERPPVEGGELIIHATQVGETQPVIVTEAYVKDTESWPLLIWLSGISIMALYSLVAYWKLKRQLIAAVPLGNRVYIADHIPSPFVLGLILPKIYLPSGLNDRERAYILLHERHHIRRLDHIWKALGFLALTVHWFNPLVWIAFILAGKDMEMSCDEAVVKRMGEGIRADYSRSILTFATGRPFPAGTPLAFGEGDPKGRIRNLLNWKKPRFWVIALSALACIALAVGLLTDPAKDKGSIQMTDTDMTSSAQFALDQGPLTGGRIVIQHWANGRCTQSPYLFLDGSEKGLSFRMDLHRDGNYVSGCQIQTDVREAGDTITPYIQSFDFPVTGAVTGWGFSSFGQKRTIALEPGDDRILAGWFFDVGTAVQGKVLERSLIEQEPERLRELENAIVVVLSFDDPDSDDKLTLKTLDAEPEAIRLNYEVDLGDWVEGGSVYPELWVDGECSGWAATDLPREAKSLTIGLTMEKEGTYHTAVTCDLAAGSLGIHGSIPLPEEKKIIGWGLMTPEQGTPLQASRGGSRILAALYFDMGGGVRIIDCESLEKEPERLEQDGCILLIRAGFPREYGLQRIENPPSEPKQVLTLEKLMELSEKGEALTWEDFEDFVYTDVGFGNIVLRYETDDPSFSLRISGPSLEDKPLSMILTHTQDPIMDDDIRYMNVTEYIRRYSDTLTGGQIQEEYPLGKIFMPLESYDRTSRISYYVPTDQEAWLEEFRKVDAASKEGGWSEGEFYTGLQVDYNEIYYMLSDQGSFILCENGDVRVAGPEASADLREMMTKAADDFYGGRRFSQEALAGETLVKATLNDGNRVLTDTEKLKQLQRILTKATAQRGILACDFSRRLTLEAEDGVCTNIYLSVDGCGTYTADGLYFQYSRSIGEDGLLDLFKE